MNPAAATIPFFMATASFAAADPVCMEAAEMEAALIDWYGEAPVDGAMAEDQQLWASDTAGTWTLMQLRGDGTACVLGQGDGWDAGDDPLVALRDSVDQSGTHVSSDVTAFRALLSEN